MLFYKKEQNICQILCVESAGRDSFLKAYNYVELFQVFKMKNRLGIMTH